MPRNFSPEQLNILSLGGNGGSTWVREPWFYLSIAAGKLLSTVGLVLFRPWGRWLLLSVVAISLASVPFAGISVGASLDNLIGYFLSLTDGAILALAFSTPIAEAIKRDE